MKPTLNVATAIVISLGLLLAAAPDASAGSRKAGRVLGGVAAGVAGAIILNEIAKGQRYEDRRDYYYERPRISCRELDDRCYHGQDWACRKFDRQC